MGHRHAEGGAIEGAGLRGDETAARRVKGAWGAFEEGARTAPDSVRGSSPSGTTQRPDSVTGRVTIGSAHGGVPGRPPAIGYRGWAPKRGQIARMLAGFGRCTAESARQMITALG